MRRRMRGRRSTCRGLLLQLPWRPRSNGGGLSARRWSVRRRNGERRRPRRASRTDATATAGATGAVGRAAAPRGAATAAAQRARHSSRRRRRLPARPSSYRRSRPDEIWGGLAPRRPIRSPARRGHTPTPRRGLSSPPRTAPRRRCSLPRAGCCAGGRSASREKRSPRPRSERARARRRPSERRSERLPALCRMRHSGSRCKLRLLRSGLRLLRIRRRRRRRRRLRRQRRRRRLRGPGLSRSSHLRHLRLRHRLCSSRLLCRLRHLPMPSSFWKGARQGPLSGRFHLRWTRR